MELRGIGEVRPGSAAWNGGNFLRRAVTSCHTTTGKAPIAKEATSTTDDFSSTGYPDAANVCIAIHTPTTARIIRSDIALYALAPRACRTKRLMIIGSEKK